MVDTIRRERAMVLCRLDLYASIRVMSGEKLLCLAATWLGGLDAHVPPDPLIAREMCRSRVHRAANRMQTCCYSGSVDTPCNVIPRMKLICRKGRRKGKKEKKVRDLKGEQRAENSTSR